MPIPEKIDIANQRYCDKLKEVQSLVNAESADPDLEKKAIGLLMQMLELKTEAEILGRVVKHQTSGKTERFRLLCKAIEIHGFPA